MDKLVDNSIAIYKVVTNIKNKKYVISDFIHGE